MSTFSGYAEPPSASSYTLPLPVIIITIFLVLFFFGFLTVYFCRCILENLVSTWNQRRNPSGAVAATTVGSNMSNGLDPELIQAFPTFHYSTVKEFRRDKYGLECAICLGEFSDDDMLRLLTICCHVFHKECVDLWLESHKTCPFCRGELDEPRKLLDKSPILVHSNSMHEIRANRTSLQDAVCIDIKEDNNEKVGGGEGEAQASLNASEQHHRRRDMKQKFSRSHSTGHSISRTREECRYTLRLPDHVKMKIIRGHNSARSCIAFGDFASPSDYRTEGSVEASETCQGKIDKV